LWSELAPVQPLLILPLTSEPPRQTLVFFPLPRHAAVSVLRPVRRQPRELPLPAVRFGPEVAARRPRLGRRGTGAFGRWQPEAGSLPRSLVPEPRLPSRPVLCTLFGRQGEPDHLHVDRAPRAMS
jgi:hypothetical protein